MHTIVFFEIQNVNQTSTGKLDGEVEIECARNNVPDTRKQHIAGDMTNMYIPEAAA